MGRISDKKEKILKFIENKYSKDGIPPTVREIAKAVGLSSTSSVQAHLNSLFKDGLIKKDGNKNRSLTPSNLENTKMVPIVGRVTAGVPILATENLEGYISVPYSLSKGNELFALKIKGDSMKNAAILDKDIVIVKSTPLAENGDIVVALIDDEATVKRFYKENNKFILKPENENYEPIITDKLTVLGKVIAVIRYY